MSESNRTLNRVILLLLAAAGFAVAVTAAWPVIAGAPLPLLHPVSAWLRGLRLDAATWAWIVAAVAALVIIVALAWIITRRRVHARAAIDADAVVIDTAVVEGLLRSRLAGAPDVVGISAVTHRRRRGQRLLHLRVQVRPRADLVATAARLEDALREVDRALGAELSTVVHITTGLRSVFARNRRVD